MRFYGPSRSLLWVRWFDEISRRRRRLKVSFEPRLIRKALGFQTTQKSTLKTSTMPSCGLVLPGQVYKKHAVDTFFLLKFSAFYRFWKQHLLSCVQEEPITRLGWRLRRWFWHPLKNKILTIQTTPKSAQKASMAPSCDFFEIRVKFVISDSLFWRVSNGSTPVREKSSYKKTLYSSVFPSSSAPFNPVHKHRWNGPIISSSTLCVAFHPISGI